MPAFSCPALERCLRLHIDTAAADEIVLQLPVNDADALYNLYDRAIVLLERALWSSGLSQPLLDDYHALFVELEAHIMAAGDDFRHRFVVVVPVADRPQQLRRLSAEPGRYAAGFSVWQGGGDAFGKPLGCHCR